MAKKKEDIEKDLKDSAEDLKEEGIKGYEKIIDRLDGERKHLRKELDRNYQEGRRYVRSNPEEGVLLGLVGGLTLGFLLGRLIK